MGGFIEDVPRQPTIDEIGDEQPFLSKMNIDGNELYIVNWYGINERGIIYPTCFPVINQSSTIPCPVDWIAISAIENASDLSPDKKEEYSKVLGNWTSEGWIVHGITGRRAAVVENGDNFMFLCFAVLCQIDKLNFNNETLMPLGFKNPQIVKEELQDLADFYDDFI